MRERTLSVNIPAGVEDGTRIRLAGEGEAGMRGGPAGDLYIFLSIKPHEFFQRDGADIFCRVPISMTTAALGGQIDVPTIDGGKTRVKVPEGTETGKQFRLKGKGMPVLRSKVDGRHVHPGRGRDAQEPQRAASASCSRNFERESNRRDLAAFLRLFAQDEGISSRARPLEGAGPLVRRRRRLMHDRHHNHRAAGGNIQSRHGGRGERHQLGLPDPANRISIKSPAPKLCTALMCPERPPLEIDGEHADQVGVIELLLRGWRQARTGDVEPIPVRASAAVRSPTPARRATTPLAVSLARMIVMVLPPSASESGP